MNEWVFESKNVRQKNDIQIMFFNYRTHNKYTKDKPLIMPWV